MIKIHYERENNANTTHCELEGSGPELFRALSEIVMIYCEQTNMNPVQTCAGICAAQELIRQHIDRMECIDCTAIRRANDGVAHE